MNSEHPVFRRGNPFPETPADTLAGSSFRENFGTLEPLPPITVRTDGLDELQTHITDYFAQPPSAQRSRGRALAVVGRLGVGKTHLANSAIKWIRDRHPSSLLWTFDPASSDLRADYRNQISLLRHPEDGDELTDERDEARNKQRLGLEAVLRDYSADATARRLRQGGVPGPQEELDKYADRLLRRQADPDKVISYFPLDDEDVYQETLRRLNSATEPYQPFGTALSLLLEPDTQQDVWDWLSGDPPSSALQVRGVNTSIGGTREVLIVLTLFALLYQNTQERCVLVLDSAEQVLEWERPEREAFEILVDTYIRFGGLLIFCIQPEPFGSLRNSLHDRIVQIWPKPLQPDRSRELITDYLRAHRLEPADSSAVSESSSPLWPFKKEAVEKLISLSRGHPRSLLRLCQRTWHTAETTQPPPEEITEKLVHSAARSIYEQIPEERVLEEIQQTVWELPWPSRKRTGSSPEDGPLWKKVKFDLFTGSDARVSIAVFDSVLTREHFREIRDTIKAVQGRHDRAILVVVNGYLSPTDRNAISREAGSQPIRYEARGFHEQLRESLKKVADDLASAGTNRLSRTLNDEVRILADRQRVVLKAITRVEGNVEQVDRRLRWLGTSGSVPSAPHVPSAAASEQLPDLIRIHFSRAFEELGAIDREAEELRELFDVLDETGRLREGGGPRRLAFGEKKLVALGATTLAEQLLRTFQEKVMGWLRAVRSSGGLTHEHEEGIFAICRSFEITAEVLPMTGMGDDGRRLTSVLRPLADQVRQSALSHVAPSS